MILGKFAAVLGTSVLQVQGSILKHCDGTSEQRGTYWHVREHELSKIYPVSPILGHL